MSAEKKKISAKEVVSDIQAGATDLFLMRKYDLSETGLHRLLEKLVTANLIASADLNREASAAENDANDETEKYKQLFTMAEAAFNNEESRYNRIEDTAHKYIPIMIYLVSAEAFLANWVFKNLFPLKNVLDYLGSLSILLAFLT